MRIQRVCSMMGFADSTFGLAGEILLTKVKAIGWIGARLAAARLGCRLADSEYPAITDEVRADLRCRPTKTILENRWGDSPSE
jgi:hypothetical protein